MRGWTRVSSLVLGLSAVVASTFATPARAEERLADCVDERAAKRRIEPLLSSRDLSVHIDEEARGEGTVVVLVASTPDGTEVLRRSFALKPADCASAVDLVEAVVVRFLDNLPLTERPKTRPEKFPQPVALARGRDLSAATPTQLDGDPGYLDLSISVAAHQAVAPTGTDLELGLAGRWWREGGARLGLGALGRVAPSRALGAGRVQTSEALLEFSVSGGGAWRWRAGLRGGGLRAAGQGFDDDRIQWLWRFEGVGSLSWVMDRVQVGLDVAASPQRHRALADGREQSVPLTWMRVGVRLGFQLGRTSL